MTITERAEEMIYYTVEEYNKISKDISALKDDSEKLIQYLTDIKITMTPAYALKRLMFESLPSKYNDAKKTYILNLKSKTGQNIEIIHYDADNCNNETYIEALVACGKKNNVPITKQNAVNWFTKSYSRSTFFKIAFALKLDSQKVQSFLMKELGEQGYNFKSFEEIVYWFCASSNEYNDYNEAQSILKTIESALSKNTTDPISFETEYYRTILSDVNDKESLIHTLIENKEHFFFYPDEINTKNLSEAQKKEHKNIQKLIREKKDSFYASQKARIAFSELLDEVKKLFSTFYNRDFNNEQLAYVIWGGIPRRGTKVAKRIRMRDSSTWGEYVSINREDLPKQIFQNLLIRDRMDALCSGKIAVTRKDIITISYFILAIKMEMAFDGGFFHSEFGEELREIAANKNYERPQYNMFYFESEINLLLNELGFAPLYPPNRFDNIILLSTLSIEPSHFFADILEQFFPDEELGHN